MNGEKPFLSVTKASPSAPKTRVGISSLPVATRASERRTPWGATLKHAKETGIATRDVYHFPCIAAGTANTRIEKDIHHVGKANFHTMWLDIETNPSPGFGYSKTDLANSFRT